MKLNSYSHIIFFFLVQSLSHFWLFSTPWTAALQASQSFTISRSLLKLKSIESVMPSNHLILCHPCLLLPSIFPIMRVFSNEWAPCIRWPKYLSLSFSISPSSEYSGLSSLRMDWFTWWQFTISLRKAAIVRWMASCIHAVKVSAGMAKPTIIL